jgi:choline-sulfatase
VTFDTTRADHMSYAGGRPGLTPNLDRLASRGTWFSTCVATAPLTLPSHASVLTGLYPFHHGIRNNGTYALSPAHPTLARLLAEHGYATHAVVSSFVLDHQFGLNQGFETYDDDLSSGRTEQHFLFQEITADQTAAKGLAWLSARDRTRPFFLWLHFFDPHAPYHPPADLSPAVAGDPYAGEIFFADSQLGRIVDRLSKDGELRNTLVIFTADHGESLGEHGEKTHGVFVYESTTRVPLLFAGPEVPQRRVDRLVSNLDIPATVVDLLGLPPIPSGDGFSLRRVWNGEARPPVYLESFEPRLTNGWSELRAIRSQSYKVIRAPTSEGYDLDTDPGERNNELKAGTSLPPHARPLLGELDAIAKLDPFGRGEQQPRTVSAEAEKKLASLGYLTAGAARRDGALPDPKDRIQLWEEEQEALAGVRPGNFRESAARLEEILRRDPENLYLLGTLAYARLRTGDLDRAAALFRRVLDLDPGDLRAHFGLARILAGQKRFAEAESIVRKAIAAHPENSAGYEQLGEVFESRGDCPEAQRWFRKALEIEPHSEGAVCELARCLAEQGKPREALTLLEGEFAHAPGSHSVALNLGLLRARLGDSAGAIAPLRAATAGDPEDAEAWTALGRALDRLGDRAGAQVCRDRAGRLSPG